MARKRLMLSLTAGYQMAWAATQVFASTTTTLANATTEFEGLFQLGLWFLGLAACATVAYTIARSRYGMVWDEAISIIVAVAIGASGATLIGLVGATAGAELPVLPFT